MNNDHFYRMQSNIFYMNILFVVAWTTQKKTFQPILCIITKFERTDYFGAYNTSWKHNLPILVVVVRGQPSKAHPM